MSKSTNNKSTNSIRPVILATRGFKTSFLRCVGRHPITLRVASPFIGKIPGVGSVVDFARVLLKEPNRKIQLTTLPPGRGNDVVSLEQAEALSVLGVDLRFRSSPPLHSKVYQFEFLEGDRAAFIGSANFTTGGFQRNDETVSLFRDQKDNEKVKAELDRLSGVGSIPFHIWKIQNIRH